LHGHGSQDGAGGRGGHTVLGGVLDGPEWQHVEINEVRGQVQ